MSVSCKGKTLPLRAPADTAIEKGALVTLRVLTLLALLIILPLTWASAHGTGIHVLGTVTAIDSTHVEVQTPKGESVSVRLTDKTRYASRSPQATGSTPAVGDRVVIEASQVGDGLTATEVQFARPTAKTGK